MFARAPTLVTVRYLAVLTLVALALPAAAVAQQPARAGDYIVVYDRDVANVNAATDARERRRGFRSRLRFGRAVRGFAARLTADQVRALRADVAVEAVVSDRPVRALAAQPYATGEPLAPGGLRRIGAATADWVREASSADVAVIDSGIDLDHPDLNAVNGTDCVDGDGNADDDNGHGTHVAGRIGALDDGAGTVGVAPGTRLHAVKVLGADGKGLTSGVICGVNWVLVHGVSEGVRVMNMSLGAAGPNKDDCGRDPADPDPLHDAICKARDAGVLTVAAAGNGDPNTGLGRDLNSPLTLPAAYPEVLTVSAIADFDGLGGGNAGTTCAGEDDDTPASFSNFATAPEDRAHMIAAPGVCTTSTWPLDDPGDDDPNDDGYLALSGTSMAAPHVAAAAALCIGEAGAAGPCAGMSPPQVIERMRADAEAFRAANPDAGFAGDPADNPGGDDYGYLVRVVLNGPQTALTAAPQATSDDTTPTIEFGSPTPGTTFECSLDGGAFAACGSPHTAGPLPDGAHQLAVRAIDVAGSADATPAVAPFTIDTVPDPPPTTTTTQTPPQEQQPAPPDTTPPATPPDTTPPGASVTTSKRQRIATVLSRGLRVSVLCDEPCRAEARAVISSSSAIRLRLAKSAIAAGRKDLLLGTGRRVAAIRFTSKVRRRIARARSVLVKVEVVVTDAAGNGRTIKRTVRLVG